MEFVKDNDGWRFEAVCINDNLTFVVVQA